ncbi:carbonic anhydrase [Kineosporia sp. R_H_3]|uniref:carbonic anhydrase n=1 Tax=Kineosporia sp. R_H_3 TaxID=1961848 RepID=UPI001E45FD15|nr:carbonic anhydrase [Kineosporia sp. R_H_3]
MEQPRTPRDAFAALLAGNRRFVDGSPEHPNQDLGRRQQTAVQGQHPFAAVFGCMDSRVAAEIVFDRGLGDLAVVRTAGHVVDGGVLGSLEFGVTVMGIPLVVVLGHDSCGAIRATLETHRTGIYPGGYVRDIVERVTPSLVTGRQHGDALEDTDPDALTEDHTRHTVQLIVERSAAIAERVASGQVGVVGVVYRLDEGRVRLVEALGDVGVDAPLPGAAASDLD